MSFTDDEELLSEYLQWRATKEVGGVDVTPSAFLVDRTKEQALQKLIKLDALADELLTDEVDKFIGDQIKEILNG